MSSSTAAATAAALLRRSSSSSRSSTSVSHRCYSLSARDGGATASASGRDNVINVGVVGRSFSSLHQPLSTLAAIQSATSPLQDLTRNTHKACPRGFAGSSPFSSSTVVETPSPSSPSTPSSEPSPSFVRLNNIFPSPGSKSQVQIFLVVLAFASS